MRFFASASAVLAFAATALAQTADFDPINAPNEHEVVPAGKTYTVTWDAPAKYADGTVSISLIGGEDANTLVPIKDIASGIKNSAKSYEWAVDSSLGAEKAYGLVFKYESDPSIMQYSKSFKIGSAKGKGKVSTVLSATGVKTVTLTSCPVTTSSPSSTPITTHHNTTTPTPTPAKPTQTPTFVTSLPPAPPASSPAGQPAPSVPNSPAPSVPNSPAPTPTPGAGAHLVAGPFALVAAMGMAFLAL